MSTWLTAGDDPAGAAVRLVCFAHAGGDPRVLRRWASALPAGVATRVLALPGRAGTLAAPVGRSGMLSLLEIAGQAASELASEDADAPWCLYGHSFGAVLAFETARALTCCRPHAPIALVVSGAEAPHRRVDRGHARLSGPRLRDLIEDYGGTPAQLLTDTQTAAVITRAVRADLGLLSGYTFSAGPSLRCAVTVAYGQADTTLDPDAVRAWSQLSAGPVSFTVLPGGHFPLRSATDFARLLAGPLLESADTPTW